VGFSCGVCGGGRAVFRLHLPAGERRGGDLHLRNYDTSARGNSDTHTDAYIPNAHDRPDAGAADHDSRKSDGYVDVADRNSGSDRYVDVYCPTARRLVAPVRGQEPRG